MGKQKYAEAIVHCDGIMCDSQYRMLIPDWSGAAEYEGDWTYCYCPKCVLQKLFFNSNCPGCVESFKSCTFAKAFMYERSPGLTGLERNQILSGLCPFRTNGTFTLSKQEGLKEVDISERAPQDSGAEILKAVDAYCWKFHIAQKG